MKKLILFLFLLIPVILSGQELISTASSGTLDSTAAAEQISDSLDALRPFADSAIIQAQVRGDISDSLANLTIGANTTTTATNFLMVENDSLHTMEAKNLSATTTADSVFVFENNAVKLQAANLAMIENDTADVDTLSLSSRINLKADYDSPTFTTAAYGPTAASSDSSTHLANTRWVKTFVRTRFEVDSLVISGSNIIAYEGGDTLSIYVPYANRTNAAQYDAADTTGVTPDFIGQIYTNTTDSTSYVAVGLTSGGWKKITFEWIWALFIIGRITRKDEV